MEMAKHLMKKFAESLFLHSPPMFLMEMKC